MDLTKLVARGQITIVDLNDATALQVWLENNSADVQVYNSDKDTYTPDYTKTNVVITPKVYLSGSSTEQIGAGHVSNIKYKIVGIAADGTSGQLVDSTSFVTNTTNGTLTIKKNLVDFQSLNITMTATYNDNSGTAFATTPIQAQTTITKLAASTTLFDVQIYPSGFTFDKQTQGENTSTTFTAVATNGGVIDNTARYAWYRYDIDVANNTSNWEQITSTTNTDTAYLNAAGDVLTVTVNDVLNFQQYKVVATNIAEDGTTVIKKNGVDETASDWIYVVDKTDPYSVVVTSTTGDKIINGTGNTTVFARVYRNGTLIESEATPTASRKFDYYWKIFDEDGNDSTWDTTTGETLQDSNATKVGNPIKVTANDVEPTNSSSINGSRATVWCELFTK